MLWRLFMGEKRLNDKELIAELRNQLVEAETEIQRLRQDLDLARASRQLSPVRQVHIPMIQPPTLKEKQ